MISETKPGVRRNMRLACLHELINMQSLMHANADPAQKKNLRRLKTIITISLQLERPSPRFPCNRGVANCET
jgi:hypothetical protein